MFIAFMPSATVWILNAARKPLCYSLAPTVTLFQGVVNLWEGRVFGEVLESQDDGL